MSHAAAAWAIKQKGLKPATKIVLLCLADCHNPHHGCFPSQERLAEDSEMSERAVRTHLEILERLGLIRREAGGRRGGTFSSTRYVLACEDTPDQRQNLPPAESAAGKSDQRQNQVSPAAKSAGHQRQNLPTNLVREPCKKEPVSQGARKRTPDDAVRLHLVSVMKPETADAFIAHRKAKRAKLTDHAAELVARKLADHPNPDAVIEESIANGWTGVFPERAPSGTRSSPHPPPTDTAHIVALAAEKLAADDREREERAARNRRTA